ncbi:MAG: hypothetical protein BGO43_06080 [Gammaproteobacteria bacterium 39-13]|nr:O-antigen ligase family protein [Gammaproteobacteria bacterium]OJV90421.1 MAG: hypothetical protein BGO43_06080 [Gammaproteobacteria bacterium 39-13]
MAVIHKFNHFALGWDKIGQVAAISLAFVIPISTALTSIFAGLVLLSWLLGPNQTEKRRILCHHPLVGWLYPLVILTLLGIFYSSGDPQNIRHSVGDGLRLCFIPIFIYCYQSKVVSKAALWAFASAMILTLILAFLKVYAGLPIGLKYTTGAVFKSHIKTSYFMAIAAFFLAFQLPYVAKQYRLILCVIISLMIFYLLFMSVGRIGYITLVACLLAMAWQKSRVKGLVVASMMAVVMVIGAYTTSNVFHDRINLLAQDLDFYHQGGRLLESSLGSRIQFALTSTSLLFERPFFGWGTGGFEAAYAKFHEGEATLFTDNPHNEYLLKGVEFGLVGLCFLLLLFYKQWRLSTQIPIELRGFYQGVLLTFVIGCFLNSWLKDSAEGYFFCVMTAICFAALPLSVQPKLVKATLH